MKKLLILMIGAASVFQHLSAQFSLNLLPCNNCPAADANMAAPPQGFTYAAQPVPMQSQHIASDFGRRESVPGSNWHLGIDVGTSPGDEEVGDGILPIEPGTVIDIRAQGSYKVLVVRGQHCFGYGHLFFNEIPAVGQATRCGNFLLTRLDPPFTDHFAIVNLSANRALSEINLGTVTHPAVNGGQPLPTTNIVADATVAVAPIGSSSTPAAHLHLYRFQNAPIEYDYWSDMDTGYRYTHFRNPVDPLEVLNHVPAQYSLSLINVSLTYPGTGRTSIQVRAHMQGQTGSGPYSTANTLEEVALQLRRFDRPDFEVLKGLRVDNRIAEGSKQGTQRYPSQGIPAHNVGNGCWDIAHHLQGGNLARMGIAGFAYGTQSYDSYFFTDIYTRISGNHVQNAAPAAAQTFARNHEEAMYGDGTYALRAIATDLRGVQTASPTLSRVFDNYRPFVQAVTIRNALPFAPFQPLMYRRDLDYLPSGNVRLDAAQPVNPLDLNDRYQLVIRFSEPVRPASVSVTNNRGLQFDGPTWDPGQREATFTLPYGRLLALSGSPDEWVCLTIRAEDHNGNPLFNPALMPGQPNQIEIPKRGASNTWVPVPVGTSDNNHCFRVRTCTGGHVAGENAPPNPNTRINSIRWASTQGQCDGQIDLLPGNNGPYTYTWSHGATTEDAQQLCPGIYSVTVVDASGCDRTLYAQIEACSGALLLSEQVACEAGRVSLSASFPDCAQGTARYMWDNGAETASVAGLPFGTYQVTATCAYNGCSASASTTVGGQTSVQVVSIVPATDNCNGQALIQVTGNAGPYTFQWSNGTGKRHLLDACAGVYVLTVTDAHGCTQSLSVTIGGCGGALYAWESVRQPCSAQAPDGAIDLEIYGCLAPYGFAWSHGATTPRLNGLAPGSYCVTVTSADQCCSTTKCIDLQPALSLSGSPVEACPDGSGGGVLAVAVTQTALPPQPYGYSFQWSNGNTRAELVGVSGGSYCVTATAHLDGQARCSVERCFSVPQSSLQITGLVRTAPCAGQSNGRIESQVAGGAPPYNYAWSNGQTRSLLTGIPWGTYRLTVTDQRGCTASMGTTLWPALLIPSGTVRNACTLLANGQIELLPSAQALTYQWSNGATTRNLYQLSAGQYCVTATDPNGCTGSACFAVGTDKPILVFRPDDCRFVDLYCHGQYVDSQEPGITQIYADNDNCTLNYACANGQVYEQIQGIGGSGFIGGYQFGAPYCRYQEWCLFPDGSVSLGLGWPASVYSEMINVSYTDCPSGMAYADYCDGSLLGIRCLNIASPNDRTTTVSTVGAVDSSLWSVRLSTHGNDPVATLTNFIDSFFQASVTTEKVLPLSWDASWKVEKNPFSTTIKILATLPQNGAATLRLYNVLGQAVHEHRTMATAGDNRWELYAPDELPDGFYLLELDVDGLVFPPIKCLRQRP